MFSYEWMIGQDKKIDINWQDQHGKTVLFPRDKISAFNTDIMEMLLNSDGKSFTEAIDINIQDNEGKTW